MFGFGKAVRVNKITSAVAEPLVLLLAVPRAMNGGKVPDSLRNDAYVLGYLFMMCLCLYVKFVGGQTDPEEKGFVLSNSLAIALDMNARSLMAILQPQMESPSAQFQLGVNQATIDFEKIEHGDADSPYAEFRRIIREKC